MPQIKISIVKIFWFCLTSIPNLLLTTFCKDLFWNLWIVLGKCINIYWQVEQGEGCCKGWHLCWKSSVWWWLLGWYHLEIHPEHLKCWESSNQLWWDVIIIPLYKSKAISELCGRYCSLALYLPTSKNPNRDFALLTLWIQYCQSHNIPSSLIGELWICFSQCNRSKRSHMKNKICIRFSLILWKLFAL